MRRASGRAYSSDRTTGPPAGMVGSAVAGGDGAPPADHSTAIGRLETHVKVLWMVLGVTFGLGAAAIGGSYVGLRDHIDDNHEKTIERFDTVNRGISDLRVELAKPRPPDATPKR